MHADAITHIPANAREKKNLTKYPSGSLGELWTISLPLMLSMMSGSLMLFIDRLLLAQFSIDALNACVNASCVGAAIQFMFLTTAAISEVFVGQYNGAGRYHKIAQPVWQMIWFSALTTFIFIPIGIFCGPLFFFDPQYAEFEISYFKWLMFFGPVFCMSIALSAFYIGRGKVKFVTFVVVLANILNIGLDIILIFGFEPFVPSFGIAGAAIATGISQVFQCVILFASFLQAKYRERYGSGNWSFDKKSFMMCLKIGLPNSLAHTFEIIAWVVFFRMMTAVSNEHITVVAICQSIFMLFTFVAEGISKGATAIAANLIGAQKWDLVWKLFRSGVKFYLAAFLVLGLVLVVDPGPMIDWFIGSQASTPEYENIRTIAITACVWMWVYFLFDGIHWLVVGLLTASGDTKFVMYVGGLSAWIFAVLPIYYFVNILGYQADTAWLITAVYGCLVCMIYLWRFKSEKWQQAHIAQETVV
jgi:multidrug resistance protein, MATE family